MRDQFHNLAVIIPAYQPTAEMVGLVRALLPYHYGQIILINDGSDKSCDSLFQSFVGSPIVKVLTHDKNKGLNIFELPRS